MNDDEWKDDPRKHPKLFIFYVLIIVAVLIMFPDAGSWFGGE